jgi:hypothetical protein
MFEKNQKNENVSILKSADHSYSDGLHAAAHQAGETVRGMVDSASNELAHAGTRLRAEIRSNPIRSSVIALGAGAVLALLIRR